MHHHSVAVARHFRCGAHHDPVFGAMVVLLQRKLVPGLDDDALDLMAVAAVDRLIIAPGTIDAADAPAPPCACGASTRRPVA